MIKHKIDKLTNKQKDWILSLMQDRSELDEEGEDKRILISIKKKVGELR